jgi:adenylyl-sulfate kinase
MWEDSSQMAPPVQGVTIWFTGLPRSGKTTLSRLVVEQLCARGVTNVELLDGDAIRRTFSAGLGYSKADRDENVRRIAEHARTVTEAGTVCIVAAISPYAEARARARATIGHFLEIHCAAPVAVCAARDTTGLYERAFAGEIDSFTGVSDPYEVPETPDLRLDTAGGDPAHLAGRVLRELETRGYLARAADARPAG